MTQKTTDEIRKLLSNAKLDFESPNCVRCGESKFELSRTADSQILAVCINCGEPYQLDAVDGNLQFWSPKMEQEE